MSVELSRVFRFEAAHHLPNLPDGHKCRRLHGHSFEVEVAVAGEVDAHTGLYVDFKVISEAMEPILDALDHRYLNEIEGLGNPTSEHLAAWIWQRLVGPLPGLTWLRVSETPRSRCVYRGGPLTGMGACDA